MVAFIYFLSVLHLFERSEVEMPALYAVVKVQLGREGKECLVLLAGQGR